MYAAVAPGVDLGAKPSQNVSQPSLRNTLVKNQGSIKPPKIQILIICAVKICKQSATGSAAEGLHFQTPTIAMGDFQPSDPVGSSPQNENSWFQHCTYALCNSCIVHIVSYTYIFIMHMSELCKAYSFFDQQLPYMHATRFRKAFQLSWLRQLSYSYKLVKMFGLDVKQGMAHIVITVHTDL